MLLAKVKIDSIIQFQKMTLPLELFVASHVRAEVMHNCNAYIYDGILLVH